MKCDILFHEMLKYIEEGERVAITYANQDTTSWLYKMTQIEQRLEKASDLEQIEEVWGSVWRQKIISLIEKIDTFEKDQLDSLVLDDSQRLSRNNGNSLHLSNTVVTQKRAQQPLIVGTVVDTTNVSLPDISSTEIAPNKLIG